MTQNVGIVPAKLQTLADKYHSDHLKRLVEKVDQAKYELIHTIDPFRRILQKFLHDPQYKGKERDLSSFKEYVERLEGLYKSQSEELHKGAPDREKKVQKQLEDFKKTLEGISHLKEEDLEFLDGIVEQLRSTATRTVEHSANEIFLFGQLTLAISHILSLMQKTQSEFAERLARATRV